MVHSIIMFCVMLKRVSTADSPNPKLKWKSQSEKDTNNVFFFFLFFHRLPHYYFIFHHHSPFNSGFVYLSSPSLSRHLLQGICSNLAPHAESGTDCFVMGVYLAACLGLYGSCWTLAGIMRLRAER